MNSGINTICFAASYGIALVLEVSQLWVTIRYRRLLEIFAASAGLVAHTWYLGRRVAEQPAAPLASQQDWFLLAAWILAVVYLAARFYYPNRSLGLFLLPGVEGLVGASVLASREPLVSVEAPRWGIIHGLFLMLGTVAVLVGFLAGLMYLLQSRRLKAKRVPQDRFRLPSLEWLQRANSHALASATVMMCAGFLTGVITRIAQRGQVERFSWTDPVVISLAAMTLWLLAAEAFRLLYPAARQGRKIAYLTVAAFVFLLLVLFAAVMWGDRFHQQRLAQDTHAQAAVLRPLARGGAP